MKLQTLNVDVAVNAKTMERGLREAEEKVRRFGSKGAALVGGGIGKIGGLSSLGGGLGAGAIGAAGMGAAVMAPFKLGRFVVNSFADATKRATDALEGFESGKIKSIYRETGVSETFARRLATGADAAQQASASQKGWMDTFWGAMADDQGRLGGIGGFVAEEYGKGGGETIKEAFAFWGSLLGGKGLAEASIQKDMATSSNPAAYQADLDYLRSAREWQAAQDELNFNNSGVGQMLSSLRDLFS